MVVMNQIDDCHECGNKVFADIPNYCPDVVQNGGQTQMTDCPGCGYHSFTDKYEYCPYCGAELPSDELTYPFEVTYYFHDQVSIVEIEDGWEIEEDEYPDLVDRLRYVGHELQVTYEVGEDNIVPVAVNGNPIDYSEEYEYRENGRGYNV